jgi:Lon protease-like protein
MSDPGEDDRLAAVPLFPLPNVVLFPRAILPLHIFEERYKAMTVDALGADERIAMALLKPGWEKNYYGKAEIDPVVCVGEIVSWERLGDGCYNFLLRGLARARIVRELPGRPYRRGQLTVLEEAPALEIDLEGERERLRGMFSGGVLTALPVARQFQALVEGPLPTPAIADLAAFYFLEDLELKQALLGDGDVKRRVVRTAEALAEWAGRLKRGTRGFPTDPEVN